MKGCDFDVQQKSCAHWGTYTFLLEFYFSEMANAVKLSIRGSRIGGGIENREFCVYRTF